MVSFVNLNVSWPLGLNSQGSTVCYPHLKRTRADMFADITELKDGILPCQWLRVAAAEDIITGSYKIPESNFQPASLDLRLGEKAYRLICSFLPDSRAVKEKLEDLTMGEFDLRDGAILEKGRPYLIPLLEELHLPEYIHAKTNPRAQLVDWIYSPGLSPIPVMNLMK